MAHLHFVSGLICSGKSTLCLALAEQPKTILISEDQWLKTLFGPELQTMSDYVTYTKRLHALLPDHIAMLLANDFTVVMDFAANTLKQRAWLRAVIDHTGAPHTLHVMDVPLEVCKSRLIARNASRAHQFIVSEEQFDQFSAHYLPPSTAEGFTLQHHSV